MRVFFIKILFMKGKNMVIKSFMDLHNVVGRYRGKNYIYRGVKNADHELVTKLGRLKLPSIALKKKERQLLRRFKRLSRPYLKMLPSLPSNDWEWLAIAQHHSLRTRLLDWTTNPLVAAYFAVEEEHSGDSAIYVYRNSRHIKIWKYNPFKLKKVHIFKPDHITERIFAQDGVFTIHPKPNEAFRDEGIDKYVIEKGARQKIKKMLDLYGINRAKLFPGLDGLAAYLNGK